MTAGDLPGEVARGLEGADSAVVIAFRDGEAGMAGVGRAGGRPPGADELDAAIDLLVEVRVDMLGCEPWRARWR